MDATEWKFLPRAGGLADQPEALLNDILAIEFMSRRIKERAREEAEANG